MNTLALLYIMPRKLSWVSLFRIPNLSSWQFRQAVNIVAASTIVGMSYAIFGDGFSSFIPFINGSIIGLLGGVGLSAGELLLFKSIRQRITFLGIVILKSASYTLMMVVIIFTVILISRSLQNGEVLTTTFNSAPFQHFLLHEDFFIIICYAMTFISILIFTREMSRKMGQGVLLSFITGRYFKPKLEKRIFMFLDMKSSVSKAERLGDLEYHNLLRDFFRDITDCILSAQGKIHHYVGDEVVVSWPLSANTKTERCLKAYFQSLNKIQSLQEYYLSTYGLIPQFKAAFHCGEVIYGEIGEVKSEIVFHGDVVNTTARLERLCSTMEENILVSKTLIDTFPVNVQQNFRTVGQIMLRGKERSLEVFGVNPEVALV